MGASSWIGWSPPAGRKDENPGQLSRRLKNWDLLRLRLPLSGAGHARLLDPAGNETGLPEIR